VAPIQAMRHRAGQVLALSLCLILLKPGWAAASPTSSTPASRGSVSVRSAVGTLTPHALGPGQPSVRNGKAVMPFHTLAPGALRAAKLRAAAQASVGQRRPQAPVHLPLAGLFNGLNGSGLSDYAATPPDSTGAIGPTRYVEMVNQEIGVFDRTNLALLSSTDNGSFTGASALDSVSDPQIQWDAQANRWFYSAIAVSQGDNSLLFGWSKTADPSDLTNGWCRFGIGRGSDLDDYPKLGHDDDFIFIGSNVFSDVAAPNYTFETATLWAIPKPAAGDASCTGPSTAWFFADAAHPLLNQDGSFAYTPVPANTADASSTGWVISAHTPLSGDNAYLGPQTKVELWHFVSNSGSPQLNADGAVNVPSFDIPASAPQPGSTFTLDTLDARLTQAVAVNDPGAGGAEGIWTQHTIAGPGGRSVVRWYEVAAGGPPTLRQQGQIDSPTDFVFNGAISPAKGGDSAAVFYNRSSASQVTVIGAQTRGPSTPLGTMDTGELLLGTSTAPDQDYSCAPSVACRWGDYAGATPDPTNAGVVWGSSQVTGPCFVICGFFAQWQTRNFAVMASTAPPPPTVPGPPQVPSATGGNTTVDVSWAAPASDGGSPITNYEIYRGSSPGGELKVSEIGNTLTFHDTGLTNGQTYYYKVSARNAVGEGSLSSETSATPQAPPPVPPSAPTLNSATPGNGQVTLAWSAPSSNGGAAVTNYTIYRGTTTGSETFLVTVGNVTSYIDAGLTNGQTYFYTVAGVNVAGTGPRSNERSATPQAANFSVSAAPSSRSVARGGTTTYTITITPSGGFSSLVSLSAVVSPKIKATSLSFNPQTVNVPATTSSTLSVRTNKGAAGGTYTVTITATGGGLTRTTTVTLVLT
jgi:Fibronectin type III domain